MYSENGIKKVKQFMMSLPVYNNFLKQQSTTIKRIQFLILFQFVLGINRLYLLGCRKIVHVLSCIYSTVLILSVSGYLFFSHHLNTSHIVLSGSTGLGYLAVGLSVSFVLKENFIKFFHNLQRFDQILNIDKDASLTTPIKWVPITVFMVLSYDISECIICLFSIVPYKLIANSIRLLCLTNIIFDVEIIFFCVLFVFILRRLLVLKAHTFKLYSTNRKQHLLSGFSKIEVLSKNKDVDVIFLHKAYDHLHKCSRQLNSAISFPIIIMLLVSAATNIMTFKNSILYTQTSFTKFSTIELHAMSKKSVLLYSLGHFLKHVILLVALCYYSNATKTPVSAIQCVLNDVLNTAKLNKTERRKLKAYLQMTHDNEFTYNLWGVITVNMSLPLKYYSLNLTYLIMVYQFWKFIE